MLNAAELGPMDMVGVNPRLSCSGPRSGLPAVTKPGQLSLFSSKLPAPLTVTFGPTIEHSFCVPMGLPLESVPPLP